MPEQMWMDRIGYSSFLGIVLDNLLNSPRAIPLPVAALKQVPVVIRVGGKMCFQNQGKGIREQNVPVLIALAFGYEDLPGIKVDIIDRDVGQFTHPHGGVEQQSEHDLVLEVSRLEGLQACLRQQLGQAAGSARPCQFHFLPHRTADQVELLIREAVVAYQPGERGNEFRLFGWGWEGGGGWAHPGYHSSAKTGREFRVLALLRNCEEMWPSINRLAGVRCVGPASGRLLRVSV
jgi:hypothetical protein